MRIEKGMPDGYKFVFPGEAGKTEIRGLNMSYECGDVIIAIKEGKHPVFERIGLDLITRIPLRLAEAVNGFQKVIKTLDGRYLVIKIPPGCALPDSYKCILGWGMPEHQNPLVKGRLFIQFKFQEEVPKENDSEMVALVEDMDISASGEEYIVIEASDLVKHIFYILAIQYVCLSHSKVILISFVHF